MAEFKDKNGKSWTIEFDGPTLEAIANETDGLGIDIASEDGTGLSEVCQFGPRIVQACWFFCKEQAKTDGVSAEQFGKAMAIGEVIEGAETALRQALLDFTRPSRRSALTAVLDSEAEVQEKAREAVIAQVQDEATRARILNAQKAHMESHLVAIEKALSLSGSSVSVSPDTSDAAQKESPIDR